MSEETTIRVNFGRPMALFPLNSVVLLPHGMVPLHVFEERYRQMVDDSLDGPGQIAMAVFQGKRWQQEYHGRPPLRPAVCVGQIIQHHRLEDGRYHVALQGVCRARIAQELPPGDRLYRQAILEPVGLDGEEEEDLSDVRGELVGRFTTEPLTDIRNAETIAEHLKDPLIPASAILELISLSVLSDPELLYRLLAESNARRRAELIAGELERLSGLLRRAEPQRRVETPRGCSWN